MNKPVSASDLVTPKVTTGPLIGSRKAHVTPDAAPDLRVPVREVVLTKESGEPPLPVYDTSGPYTDNDVVIDVEEHDAPHAAVGVDQRVRGETLHLLPEIAPAERVRVRQRAHPFVFGAQKSSFIGFPGL